MKTVAMYSKPGCHLCDAARDEILSVKNESDFDFTEIDINADEALLEKYSEDIPVIFVNNKFLSKYNINKLLLLKELNSLNDS